MYGIRYTEEYKRARSDKMKALILEGKFTPKTENRIRFTCIYDGKRFRSSWEVAFYIKYGDTFIYEGKRIPYINENGIRRIYIADFVDEQNKIIVEIKPNSPSIMRRDGYKIEQAKAWCEENGYTFRLLTERDISKILKTISWENIPEDITRKWRTLV